MLGELDLKPSLFVNYSTVLFGESGTGKSTIIRDILFTIKDHITTSIVFSPSENNNNNYKELIPHVFINTTLDVQTLKNIWALQEARMAIYLRANDIKIIKQLVCRMPDCAKLLKLEQKAKKVYEAEYARLSTSDLPDKLTQMEKLTEEHDNCINSVFVEFFRGNCQLLNYNSLNDHEKCCVKYKDFNPNTLIILDDCTAQLDKIKTMQVVQDLFYQGRHKHITFIIACHHDKSIDSELRKNTFITIFTERNCATTYFTRPSNGYARTFHPVAENACVETFTPIKKNQKLVWVRMEKTFYKYTATMRPKFKFGSNAVWEFSNRIKMEEDSSNINNAILDKFRV